MKWNNQADIIKLRQAHKKKKTKSGKQTPKKELKFFNSYKEYLESKDWQRIRKQKFEQVGHRCQVCNNDNKILHVHHRTYKRIYNERLNDLTILCSDCHKLFHDHNKIKRLPEHIIEEIVNKMMKREGYQ